MLPWRSTSCTMTTAHPGTWWTCASGLSFMESMWGKCCNLPATSLVHRWYILIVSTLVCWHEPLFSAASMLVCNRFYPILKTPPPPLLFSADPHTVESSGVTVSAASARTLPPPPSNTGVLLKKEWESCNSSLTEEPPTPPHPVSPWKVTSQRTRAGVGAVRKCWAFESTEVGPCDLCDPLPCLSKNIQASVHSPPHPPMMILTDTTFSVSSSWAALLKTWLPFLMLCGVLTTFGLTFYLH